MANAIGIAKYYEDNLRTLAAYLLGGELAAGFNMSVYAGGNERDTLDYPYWRVDCGSGGCSIGHGPHAGIIKYPDESWATYSTRVFGLSSPHWNWCFDSDWAKVDNTPQGAAKRILYLLENGIPDDAHMQKMGFQPLSYLNIDAYVPAGDTVCNEQPAEC